MNRYRISSPSGSTLGYLYDSGIVRDNSGEVVYELLEDGRIRQGARILGTFSPTGTYRAESGQQMEILDDGRVLDGAGRLVAQIERYWEFRQIHNPDPPTQPEPVSASERHYAPSVGCGGEITVVIVMLIVVIIAGTIDDPRLAFLEFWLPIAAILSIFGVPLYIIFYRDRSRKLKYAPTVITFLLVLAVVLFLTSTFDTTTLAGGLAQTRTMPYVLAAGMLITLIVFQLSNKK